MMPPQGMPLIDSRTHQWSPGLERNMVRPGWHIQSRLVSFRPSRRHQERPVQKQSGEGKGDQQEQGSHQERGLRKCSGLACSCRIRQGTLAARVARVEKTPPPRGCMPSSRWPSLASIRSKEQLGDWTDIQNLIKWIGDVMWQVINVE